MSLQSFFAMGGYASYVWPAYAVFFAVLIADYLAPVLRRRQLLRRLHVRAARQQARQTRHAPDMHLPPTNMHNEPRAPSPE